MSTTAPLSEDALRSLWENGVRIEHAWIKFAETSHIRFRTQVLREDPSQDVEAKADPRYQEIRHSVVDLQRMPRISGAALLRPATSDR